ncbi:hypothetical protein [Haladaptatus salinisoli]|uniref:hypothetical protein n=1 Tax=Haladaptatus salinisoli TaxID=2884876 RepID=UPI001D0AFC72|nr:hypothetical protein [Haladaptatus salinisoli]
MENTFEGIRGMLLGIQLSLLGYVSESLGTATEEVNGLLLVGGTALTVGRFAAGRGR